MDLKEETPPVSALIKTPRVATGDQVEYQLAKGLTSAFMR